MNLPQRPPDYPSTPNLDKALEVRDRSQSIGEFMDWCVSKGGISVNISKDTTTQHQYGKPTFSESWQTFLVLTTTP